MRGMMKMIKILSARFLRVLTVLAGVLLALTLASGEKGFAQEKKEVPPKPIREVHMIDAGEKNYCFFVQHNVVLTQAEISVMNDEELTQEILKKAGLYAKETSCMKAQHKVVTLKAWNKAGRAFLLSEEDLEYMRQAQPADGEPVKMHMDIWFTMETPKKEEDDTGKAEEEQGQQGSGDEENSAGDSEEGSQEESGEKGRNLAEKTLEVRAKSLRKSLKRSRRSSTTRLSKEHVRSFFS